MFVEAERLGLEGVVGKRAASPYVSKRSQDWIKVNAAKSDDFVVVGFLPAKNGGTGFSALLLAQYREGELAYAGRVGGGFGSAISRRSSRSSRRSSAPTPPAAAPEERGAVWLAPGPVIQVKFKQRTPDGSLRQPTFMRRARRQVGGAMHLAGCRRIRRRDASPRPTRRPRPTRLRPRARRARSISRTSTRCSGPPTATPRAT